MLRRGQDAQRIARLRASALLLAMLLILPSPLGVTPALAASPPTDVQAQGLSDRAVELIWSAVPNADSYAVIRDGNQIATTVRTLYDDTGRSPSTSYTYQIQAIQGGIASAPSSPVTTTTQAPLDTQAPSIVGTISVKSVTSTSLKLSWKAATDNQHIEGYRILRGPAGASPSQLIDISTTDAVASYTDSFLRSGITYTYGVQAIDTEDNAGPIRTVAATTNSASDSTPPAAPSGVATRVFSSSRIDITWGASSSSDASGYQVLRNGVVVGQVDRPLRLNFSDNGLSASTTYSYTLKTIDSAGNLSAPSAARTGTTLAAGGKIIARGPYLQSVTQSSARVVWWTNVPTTSRVDFGVGALTNTVADSASTLQHVMLIAQLSAGTTYSYTVGDGSFNSGTASFKTAAPPGTTFTFAALGDFGGNAPGEAQNANLIAADGSQFIQTLGDNVYPEAADPNFVTTYSDFDGRLFKQFGAAMKLKAFWGANGNKEYYGHGAWAQHMFLPNNERWYSYDWGSAHILVLDTEMPYNPGTPQYAFAQADLAAHQSSPWRIVALQRPAYSSSTASSSSVPVRTYLVPLFEQEHVQLVLSGNSHNYERTYPLIGGVPTTGGVTYIVSGNGGNGFNSFQIAQPSWSAYRQATYYGYVRVTVGPSSIQVNEIRADTGTVIDSTTIAGQADTEPPTKPTNLSANAPTATRVDLSWTASADNVGVTGYDVYRGGTLLDSIGAVTTYTDNSVQADTTYSYTVRARDAATNVSEMSDPATVTTPTTPPPDTEPPTKPTNLSASAPTATRVDLTWTASTDNVGVTAYDIFRGGILLDSVGAVTTYTDTTVQPNTPYTYTVLARDAADNPSPMSDSASVTTPPAARTYVFSDGFESGNLSQWTTSGGLVVENVLKHSGTWAAQGNTTNGATYAKKLLSSTYADGYLRTYFYLASGYSAQVNILRYRTASDASLGYIGVSTSGKLLLRNDIGATTTTSTSSVGANAWHSLELHLVVNGTVSATEVWLDGVKVSDLSLAGQNWGTTPIGKVQIGEVITGRTYNVTFDDVAFDTALIGP